MADIVLDASALLVWLFEEPGVEVVSEVFGGDTCFISSVNLAEVATRMLEDGMEREEAVATIADLPLTIVPFDESQAWDAARLCAGTRSAGLSLADRVCIGLAQRLGAGVLTADRAWLQLSLGLTVRLARPMGADVTRC